VNHIARTRRPRVVSEVTFPQTVKQFDALWPRFKDWLTGHGAEMLQPVTRYELVRFTTPEGIGCVLRNVNDVISPNHWQGGSASAFIAWRRHDNEWRVVPKTEKLDRENRALITDQLIARDGFACCYCHESLKHQAVTIEHFVPRVCEGPNHLANLGLACVPCNEAVGHKTVVEKMRYAQARLDLSRKRWMLSDELAAARLWDFLGARKPAVHGSLWHQLKARWTA
jgi:5-methylcytosine-specific restriction endonuclease McrA